MSSLPEDIQQLMGQLQSIEKELFDLRFKKATRQPFKSHKIKQLRRQVAQIKTRLGAAVKAAPSDAKK